MVFGSLVALTSGTEAAMLVVILFEVWFGVLLGMLDCILGKDQCQVDVFWGYVFEVGMLREAVFENHLRVYVLDAAFVLVDAVNVV